MSRRVRIVGAGVIGLTIAHELAEAGDHVTIIADVDTPETVSAVSAAVWFPYLTERSAAVDELLHRSLIRFTELARIPESGVEMRTGTVIERVKKADRSWAASLPQVTEAEPHQLPMGATAGLRVTVPLIVIPTYLPWLREQVADKGVQFYSHTVSSLDDLAGDCDLVVIAAGIRGGELLGGDPTVFPVRGQIVRLANPGLTDWLTDDANPDGLTYVFPRREDVVVGGTANEGSWDVNTHSEVEAAILDRAYRLVPALRNQPVLGRAAGLRPSRPSIRLERVENKSVLTIAAYGHGGAGVTLSWGTAERVLALSNSCTERIERVQHGANLSHRSSGRGLELSTHTTAHNN